ncbi:hypothetical protein [Pseudomonas thivervalensis]|uniref:hypothetical protein n=1 Tax=Pseudomonas thivervalensis TaxID=86265 RepID=UPI003D964A79
MTDYTELRRLAEAATKSKWCTDGERQVMSAESDQLNSGFVIVDCQGPDNLKNAALIAAANPAAILGLLAEIDQLKGLVPGWPPRPPAGEGLPRYGLRWNGPQQPLAVPMADGYWTPWHLADRLKAEIETIGLSRAKLAGELSRLRAKHNDYSPTPITEQGEQP